MCPKKDGVHRQPPDFILAEKKKKPWLKTPDWYPSRFSGEELKRKIEALPAEAQREIGYQEPEEGTGSWGFRQKKEDQKTCLVCPDQESAGILSDDNHTNVCYQCTERIKKQLGSGSPEGILEDFD